MFLGFCFVVSACFTLGSLTTTRRKHLTLIVFHICLSPSVCSHTKGKAELPDFKLGSWGVTYLQLSVIEPLCCCLIALLKQYYVFVHIFLIKYQQPYAPGILHFPADLNACHTYHTFSRFTASTSPLTWQHKSKLRMFYVIAVYWQLHMMIVWSKFLLENDVTFPSLAATKPTE